MSRLVLRFYLFLRRSRKAGAAAILSLLLVILVANAATFYLFDSPEREKNGDDPLTFEDCLWYSVVSITTIGYGDFYPQSTGARVGTIFFIIGVGMVVFTMMLGIMTEVVTEFIVKGQRGMANILSTDHILIVNFPGEARVKQVIRELQSDPDYQKHDIVIITDQVEQLPFAYKEVQFVYGSPLEEEVFHRARIAEAKRAMVLANSYSDPNSDAVVASVVSVVKSIKPDIYVVAECLDYGHRNLFRSANADAMVFGLQITGNLMVQEMHDPGVSKMVGVVTSNLRGETLYSTAVTEAPGGQSYIELARGLLSAGANLLAVNRGDATFATFADLQPEQGDRVIYVGAERMVWGDLVQKASGPG